MCYFPVTAFIGRWLVHVVSMGLLWSQIRCVEYKGSVRCSRARGPNRKFQFKRAPMVPGEGVMGKINWGRVVLCGIVAGLGWTVLSSIITAFVERDFVAAVPRGRLSAPSGGLIAFLFIVNLVMGIWAIWLYAAIRPQSSPSCPRFPFPWTRIASTLLQPTPR